MLFNSPEYIFAFLPVAVTIYYVLANRGAGTAQKIWLVLVSLFFYSYWNPVYVLLLIASITVNYLVGHLLCAVRSTSPTSQLTYHRKLILILGISFNLALLGYFKYADFFVSTINGALGVSIPVLSLVLPLAISFFTFQQITYLVDCYRDLTKNHDFLNYAVFVTFFPQLIAGPIVHHKKMIPQFARADSRHLNGNNVFQGLFIFFIGLFKKVFIADTFAVWANAGFDNVDQLTWGQSWIATLSYTFQIYFDFSGYSDMAIGAALLFNIKLPINFNSPYRALNIQDFWRRWHITLSDWLKRYLYIPLGGSRLGSVATHRNILITFLLGGLWHGAGWTFVAWGALHGAALVTYRLFARTNRKLPRPLAWATTFLYVSTCWVFFRADSIEDAVKVTKTMYAFNGDRIATALTHLGSLAHRVIAQPDHGLLGPTGSELKSAVFLIIFSWVAFRMPNTLQITSYIDYHGRFRLKPNLRSVLVVSLFSSTSLLLVLSANMSEFLYFNF